MSNTPDAGQAFAELTELLADLGVDSIPEGWNGGEAYHSGGGIWTREFTNNQKELQVSYSPSNPELGVGLCNINYAEQYDTWIQDKTVEQVNGLESDSELFETALKLMQSA
jgi:hypothetical protein